MDPDGLNVFAIWAHAHIIGDSTRSIFSKLLFKTINL